MENAITGVFGFPGENINEREVENYFAERELGEGKVYFKRKNVHQYTRWIEVEKEWKL